MKNEAEEKTNKHLGPKRVKERVNGILKTKDISDEDIRAVRSLLSGDIAIVTATADQAKTLRESI